MAPEPMEGNLMDARTDIRAGRGDLRNGDRPEGVGRNRDTSLISAIVTAEPPPMSTRLLIGVAKRGVQP
jgi:hypothetical protein